MAAGGLASRDFSPLWAAEISADSTTLQPRITAQGDHRTAATKIAKPAFENCDAIHRRCNLIMSKTPKGRR
jgi:hypothetical protein